MILRLRKATKILSQNSRLLGRDSNGVPLEYKSRDLPLH